MGIWVTCWVAERNKPSISPSEWWNNYIITDKAAHFKEDKFPKDNAKMTVFHSGASLTALLCVAFLLWFLCSKLMWQNETLRWGLWFHHWAFLILKKNINFRRDHVSVASLLFSLHNKYFTQGFLQCFQECTGRSSSLELKGKRWLMWLNFKKTFLSFLIQIICDELSLLLGLENKPNNLYLATFNSCVYAALCCGTHENGFLIFPLKT